MRSQTKNLLAVVLVTVGAITAANLAAQAQVPAPTLIYPPSDAVKDIDAAIAASAKDGRHVLLDFGADWCPDCRVLAQLFEDASVAPFVEASFRIVHVDVGRRDKNGDLAAKYGATSGDWIPAVVVLDAKRNTVAVTDDKVRLTRRTSPAQLLELLQQWAPKKLLSSLGQFTERGVHVGVSLQQDAAGQTWLTAAFTPSAADAHLYGKDLPIEGINGLGRPTRLGVASSDGLTVTGDLVADRPVLQDRIEALKTTLAVYPPGPVTLRLPVKVASTGDAKAELAISYMLCGADGCLPPVIDKRVAVTLNLKR